MSFLETLRSKSPTVRAQIAFGSATVIAGTIFLIWASTLPARFEELPKVISEVTPEETGEGSFFDTFFYSGQY